MRLFADPARVRMPNLSVVMKFAFPFISLALRLVVVSLAGCSLTCLAATQTNVDWSAYLGGKGRNLYSPLRQINRTNVTQQIGRAHV